MKLRPRSKVLYRWISAFIFIVMVLAGLQGTARAAPIDATWVGGFAGNWTNTNNWAFNPLSLQFPNNNGNTFDVSIPNNNVSLSDAVLNTNVTLDSLTIDSGGSLNLANGSSLDTVNGTTNDGTMESTDGGTATLKDGIYTNTNGTIQALSGSVVRLAGATIEGGTLHTEGTGFILSAFGPDSLLDGVTIDGGSTFQMDEDAITDLKGTVTNNGTMETEAVFFGSFLRMTGGADVTLDGTGTFIMSNQTHNGIFDDGGGERLIHGANHTIEGAGRITLDVENSGLIDANVSNTLTIDPDSTSTNTNIMQASSGGTLRLEDGTFANTGGTIQALSGSVVQLAGATIEGGTLHTDATSVILNLNGVTLDGVTIDTGSTFQKKEDSITDLKGIITNNGTIMEMNPSSSGSHFRMTGGADVTLGGDGMLTMRGGAIFGAGGERLIHGANHTIEGGGMISAAITNNGTIDANIGDIDLVTNNKTNNGLMRASNGGRIDISSVDVDGTGNWEADGGRIRLKPGANVTTTGDVNALNGGKLELINANLTASNLFLSSSEIIVGSGISLSGGLTFDMTDESLWNWSTDSILEMTGGISAAIGDWDEWGFLEIGGQDFGTDPVNHIGDPLGFTKNFDLTELAIGDGAHLSLFDQIDNGNRSSAEALYVDTLAFADSLGLLNLNGLSLYYNNFIGNPDQIINMGTGQVVFPPPESVPEPATMTLLGIGLVGLVGGAVRRRFKNKRIEHQ